MDRPADQGGGDLTDAEAAPGRSVVLEGGLDRLYAGRFNDRDRRAKHRLWRVLCRSFFDRYVPAGGTVLDVGAGYCDFVNHIRAARRIALDLNPDTVRAAAEVVRQGFRSRSVEPRVDVELEQRCQLALGDGLDR